MTNFPFDAVHAHFANAIKGYDLSDGDMPPMMAYVLTDWTNVKQIDMVPVALTVEFFRDTEGKEKLGKFIRESVAEMGALPVCIVIMCEAYVRSVHVNELPEKRQSIMENGLKDDPDATECVFMQIYSATEQRVSRLPISKERIVGYGVLESASLASGRFTMNPDTENSPIDARQQ